MMTREERLHILNELFSTVLEREVFLSEDSDNLAIEGWDSLAHLLIISLIEEKFGIKFALGEQQEMYTISTILDLIEEKISE